MLLELLAALLKGGGVLLGMGCYSRRQPVESLHERPYPRQAIPEYQELGTGAFEQGQERRADKSAEGEEGNDLAPGQEIEYAVQLNRSAC